MALSDTKIKKLKANGRYLDRDGLYLQVLSPDNRAWLLRYVIKGRERWMGLGSVRHFTLDEARERARRAHQLLTDGIDPLEQKQARAAQDKLAEAKEKVRQVTFWDAATKYYDAHQATWKNDVHRKQFLSSLKMHAKQTIGDLAVADIDKDLVMNVLQPIWHTNPVTANRVRGRVETVLNYAGVHGWRDANVPNPARWRGHLALVLAAPGKVKKTKNHRKLAAVEMPAFMTALRAQQGVAARAVEFLVLTAARTSEVTGARWSEIDFNREVWVVPGERMKSGREHRVPLPDAAMTLLANLPGGKEPADFVFMGLRRTGLSSMAMDMMLRRMGYKDRATVHGFRSTFRTWASEDTNTPAEIAEAALAHAKGDKLEAAYNRTDYLLKRRALMVQWAAFCARPVHEKGEVVLFNAENSPGEKKMS